MQKCISFCSCCIYNSENAAHGGLTPFSKRAGAPVKNGKKKKKIGGVINVVRDFWQDSFLVT